MYYSSPTSCSVATLSSLSRPSAVLLLSLVTLFAANTLHAVLPAPDGGYANQNTAEGSNALFNGANSSGNTAVGDSALFSDTDGSDNTAVGKVAMFNNTSGIANTATGSSAMQFNTTGSHNTGTGQSALVNNISGNFNTATGEASLDNNHTGNNNCAFGFEALAGNIAGSDNTAYGYLALLGPQGGNNIAIGSNAGSNLTSGNNNIAIGNAGVAGESRTIRIGTKPNQKSTYIAGISGATVAGGVSVVVDTSGHLGTITSSARYKDQIRPMKTASEEILSLRPVQFRYKKELDPQGIPQYGLVAEEVAKIAPDLVANDESGRPYTVRYEAVNAMLLNEFIKAHGELEEQKKTISDLRTQLEKQDALIQKVSEKIEAFKP